MGMTIYEKRVYDTTINKNIAIANFLNNIDWERRRFEIAKEVFPGIIQAYSSRQKEDLAKITVDYADALIEKLKERANER